MRPINDKEMEAVDLDQLFQDYVETDLLQHCSQSTADRSSSNDLAHLFDLPSSNEIALLKGSSIPNRDPWQKPAPAFKQNPASAMASDCPSLNIGLRAKESLSDPDLLSFEDLFELERNQLRSVSQPSTPRPHSAKSVKKAVSFQEGSISRGIQKLSRKIPATSRAKMMQPPFYRSPIPDVWTRKMESATDNFALRGSPNGISSPPPSSRIVQHENANGFFPQDHQSYTNDQSPLASPTMNNAQLNFSTYQITPQASPAIGICNGDGNSDPFNDDMRLAFSSSASSTALSALQTPPSSLRLPMTTWGPDTSPSLGFGFSASPEFSTTKTAGWWDAHAAQQTGSSSYQEPQTPSTRQNMAYSSAAIDGLGITCDSTSFSDFGVGGLGISGGDTTNGTPVASFDMAQYTSAMYHDSPHHNIVTIGHRPLSRTPSPCPQPAFHRRRPSSHSHPSQNRTQSTPRAERRKSSNGSNSTSSRQSSSGNVGFVNFTPHDSRKILTGVAPSGSSKTKARREKEAAEKRRKLSQAAVKAVMEAGGDVDSLRRLEREGLLVLES